MERISLKTFVVFLVIFLLGILSLGCSTSVKLSTSSENSTFTEEFIGKEHIIDIRDSTFYPSMVNVRVGDKVIWVNNDYTTQTVTSNRGNELQSKILSPGDIYEHVFSKSGVYEYHSSVHPSMRGRIVVKNN